MTKVTSARARGSVAASGASRDRPVPARRRPTRNLRKTCQIKSDVPRIPFIPIRTPPEREAPQGVKN